MKEIYSKEKKHTSKKRNIQQIKEIYSKELFKKQQLEKIETEWVADDTLVKIMPRTPDNCSVQILAPVNKSDRSSIEAVLLGLQGMLINDNIEHMMFPVGPGHWYWVKISKGEPFTVTVYDPYNHNHKNIFNFLKPNLNSIGITGYQKIEGKFSVPQQDGYACGYFVAAKAHQLLKELAPDSNLSKDNIIKVLAQQGNHHHQLRNAFITEYTIPFDSETTTSSTNDQRIKEIIKKTAPKHTALYKAHLHSLFEHKASIEQYAETIKNIGAKKLCDGDLAYRLQAAEFAPLIR